MKRLLIIEDEPLLGEAMEVYLTTRGYHCEKVVSIEDGRHSILDNEYDTIILDITLPDGNGLHLLDLLKLHQKDPRVLIVSAKDSLFDKLNGLDLGADDYITKPFHLEELAARINALLRRKSTNDSNKVVIDDLVVDSQTRSAFYNDELINLTKKEYALLLYFIINKGRVVSKQSIAFHLWGAHYATAENYDAVYVHAMNLRKKLSAHTGKDYIETVYGIGYKFTAS